MNPRNTTLILALIILVITVVPGCRKTISGGTSSPPAAPVSATTPPAVDLNHPASANASVAQTKFFKGSIGSAGGLQMKLTREGDSLKGTYFYQKVGTKIDIKGNVDLQGNITLEEYDTGGKQTGLFKGLWKSDNPDGLISIAGNWSRPNGEKKTAFSLHEEPIELTGAEIVAKKIKESNKKLNYDLDVQYPQITSPLDNRFEKFNQEARSLVAKLVAAFKSEMANNAAETTATPEVADSETSKNTMDIGYDVSIARDDLISIVFSLGSYYSGAAHPNSSSQALNYDVKNGKKLNLADIFKSGAKYLQTISAYCMKDLKRQSKANNDMLPDDMIQSGASAKASNYQVWAIRKNGIEIIFDAYQVGPYAAGPQTVVVPYSELKDLVNPDSPIGLYVK